MAPRGPNQQADDAGMMFLALLVVIVAVFFLYDYIKPTLHLILMYVAYFELMPIAPFVAKAARIQANIFTHVPEELSFEQITDLLCYSGQWYVWAFITPYFCYRMYAIWCNSLAGQFSRNLNMQKLLANNIKCNPCIAPIVNWPRSLLEEPMDSGYWMTARQPIQYCVENGLLFEQEGKGEKKVVNRKDVLDKSGFATMKSKYIRVQKSPLKFDREKAEKLMLEQMGPRFQGFQKMPRYLQKLCCAFVLYATGDKKRAQQILDQMSISFRGPAPASPARFVWYPPFYIPAKKASKFQLNDKLPKDAPKLLKQGLELAKGHTSYTYLVVLAMYEAARSKGVLNTAEFIWLRPVNRKMFYLCNNFGRLVAWTEIAGPWNHYQAEKLMSQFDLESTGIDKPDVMQAVNALETCMYEEGWLEELSKAARDAMPLGALD